MQVWISTLIFKLGCPYKDILPWMPVEHEHPCFYGNQSANIHDFIDIYLDIHNFIDIHLDIH